MADDARFSHITVGSDDDDDIVIHAGARHAPAGDEAGFGAHASRVEAGAEAQRVASAEAPHAAPAPKPPSAVFQHELRPAHARREANDAGARREDAPQDDLDVGPMSFTQKIVLILAAALLVAAVAYYFLFMR